MRKKNNKQHRQRKPKKRKKVGKIPTLQPLEEESLPVAYAAIFYGCAYKADPDAEERDGYAHNLQVHNFAKDHPRPAGNPFSAASMRWDNSLEEWLQDNARVIRENYDEVPWDLVYIGKTYFVVDSFEPKDLPKDFHVDPSWGKKIADLCQEAGYPPQEPRWIFAAYPG